MDVFEVHDRKRAIKLKVLLLMDLASRFKVISELFRYPAKESRAETGSQVVEVLICLNLCPCVWRTSARKIRLVSVQLNVLPSHILWA